MRIRVSAKGSGSGTQSVFYDYESSCQISIKELKTYPFESLSFTKSEKMDEDFYKRSVAKIDPKKPFNHLVHWREQSDHTLREMGKMLGVDVAHIWRVIQETRKLSHPKIEKVKKIMELEHLIRCKPADVILLKYELDQLVGGV